MTKEQSTRRYSMHEYHGQVLAEIDDGGTWVKHEDYERVVAELIGRIAALGGFRDEPTADPLEFKDCPDCGGVETPEGTIHSRGCPSSENHSPSRE